MTSFYFLVCNQVFTRHIRRLFQSHNMQDGGRHVSQTTVLHRGAVVVRHIDKRHRVQ